MDKFSKIQDIINNHNEIDSDLSKEELINKLFVYYEGLIVQNNELKRVNEKILNIKDSYQELFDFAPVSYFIINDKGVILDANRSAKNLFGDIVGQSIVRYVDFQYKKDFYIFLKNLLMSNYSRISTGLRIEDGLVHVEVISKRIESKKNEYLIACIDFEKQYKTIQEINDISYKDHLTGLYNRRYFETLVSKIRYQNKLPFSFVFADANGLKIINDSLGHLKGDEFLKKVSKLIFEVFSEIGSIIRIGGDEFVVILPKTDSEQCSALIKLCEEKCSHIEVEGVKFSISFGSSTMNDVSEDIYSAIFEAEGVMYRNKLLNEAEDSERIIGSIRNTLYSRLPLEKEKSEKVKYYINGFARYLLLGEEKIETLNLAAENYNIGKISYDSGKVNDFAINYEDNVEIAYRILKKIPGFSKVAYIILCSNEYINGQGVPNNLTGDSIPFESKILAVCKNFVALTLNGSETIVFTKADALAEIEANAGIKYDSDVVEKFVDYIHSHEDI